VTKKLKIAFITSADPLDRRAWSGIYYSMLMAIQKHWGDVHCLGPITTKRLIVEKIFNKITQLLFSKKYNYQHSIFYSMNYGRIFKQKLEHEDFDIIFAPAASTGIACLKTKTPIIYCCDATFKTVLDYYAVYSNLLDISVKEGNWIERSALHKAKIVLYSSEWAKNSALKDYHINNDKLFIIPFGANLDDVPTTAAIYSKKKTPACRLLFLGVDWERKGGDIAFETFTNLIKMGIDTEFTVCGCIPPAGFSHKKMRTIPFLDKYDVQQNSELKTLLTNTDFLILPTRAEGFGIVFCEANAFGVPAITTDTGGVCSAVTNGENGYTLPLSATSQDFAQLIADIFQDDARYYALIQSSRIAYEERLNWDVWAHNGRKIISETLGI
jgi:glycosyltransferase involved in cell wall biosynthesis